MTRTLQSPAVSVSLSATVRNQSTQVSQTASGLVRHTKSHDMESGIDASQANRAWEWTATLTSGSNQILDLSNFSGFDLFGSGNDGADICGQTLDPFEEVVAI